MKLPANQNPRNLQLVKDYKEYQRHWTYGGLKQILSKYGLSKQRAFQIMRDVKLADAKLPPFPQAPKHQKHQFVEFDETKDIRKESWERVKASGLWPTGEK